MMSVMPLRPSAEEATRKAGALWIGDALVWHAWHEGAAWVVCGGLEQPHPGTGAAVITVRALGGVHVWEAMVTEEPWTEELAALLHATRLNPPDGENQPARWAASSTLLRITPSQDTPGFVDPAQQIWSPGPESL